jgi:Domain of unknown function (DUF4864)
MIARLLASLVFLALAVLPLRAESPTAAEAAEFQRIISSQIAAFNADDGSAAYGFAAPMIQKAFPSAEQFMQMVKTGYPQVYRQKSVNFEDAIVDSAGRPGQKVRIVDTSGQTWIALYSMEKQADGTWRISGCYLLPAPGVGA